MSDLLYEKRDHYAIFTFNRPERMNALGVSMRSDLENALQDFTADPDMRVGILTGAGRAFCAGLDLREAAERAAAGDAVAAGWVGAAMGFPWSQNPKPIIAAVNGAALGGGCEHALDCDIRICSTEAYFGLWEVRRGLVAGYAMHHLPRMIGAAAANYALLAADRITPEMALQFGIVTEVVSPDKLLPRAIEIAEMVASNAPVSVQTTKAAVQMWLQHEMLESKRLYEWMGRFVFDSEDAKEGATAFAEKRTPVWKGR